MVTLSVLARMVARSMTARRSVIDLQLSVSAVVRVDVVGSGAPRGRLGGGCVVRAGRGRWCQVLAVWQARMVPSLNDGLVRVVAVEGVGLGVGLGGRRDGWCRVRGWFR